MKILVINPGSTSTKIAVYEDEKPILLRNITHTAEELSPYGAITEQQDFRRQIVLDELRQANISLEFDAVIGRGGLSCLYCRPWCCRRTISLSPHLRKPHDIPHLYMACS